MIHHERVFEVKDYVSVLPVFLLLQMGPRRGLTHTMVFCTERRLLWLARPQGKALARQAFSGRGGSPKPSSITG